MTPPIPRLVEPQQLTELIKLHSCTIIDLCSEALYRKTHIPGAIHLPPSWLLNGQPPSPGLLPSLQQLSKVFSYLGINSDQHLVLYDDEGGGWAGRLAWTLDLLGYDNWSYVNGGMVAWLNEGHPTESGVNTPNSCEVHLRLVNEARRFCAEQIMARLDDESLAIWDARSPEEYSGESVRAERGGHIPGAINLEWTQLMDQQRNLRIRSDAAQLLHTLGLGADKTIVTHCQTHHRSGFTYMVARILGYTHVSAYDGSWSEWGNRTDTPIECGF